MIINAAANRAYACAPVSRARNNDNAFSEALETTENSAEDTLLASAPDKWVTEPGISFNAVKKALEYKKSLAYLGVFSYDDLIQTSPLDTRPGGNSVLSGYVAEMQSANYGLLDTARMSVEHLENMFSFYSERAMDPSRAVSGDSEFAELIRQRYLPYSQRFFEFVDELLGRDVEEVPQESVVPDIQDSIEDNSKGAVKKQKKRLHPEKERMQPFCGIM